MTRAGVRTWLLHTVPSHTVIPSSSPRRTSLHAVPPSHRPWSKTHAGFLRRYDDWSNTYVGIVYRGAFGRLKLGLYAPHGKQDDFSRPRTRELFNLTADPFELTNVHGATAASRPELVSALEAKLRDLHACSGPGCSFTAASDLRVVGLVVPTDGCDARGAARRMKHDRSAFCTQCLACSVYCPLCEQASPGLSPE